MAAKQALGRGFDSLIPSELLDESFDPTARQDDKVSDLRSVLVKEIIADPDQPRRHFDEAALAELAASIKEHGVVQPIVLTPRKKGGYQIVAGERRFRAASKVGLERIPAIVRTLSNQHKLELALIENLQRQDLNSLETATAYAKLRDQFNLTMEQIGQRVGGRSASTISNTMRLLQLPAAIKEALGRGEISEGQARPLIHLPEAEAVKLADAIISENWSARRVEAAVAEVKRGGASPKKSTAQQQRFQAEAAQIGKHLAARVRVRASSRGSGSITISFTNADEFERLLKKLS